MSRSAVVALVVGLALAIAFAGVAQLHWDALARQSRLGLVIVLGGTSYGAALAAVSLRRILDPKLPVPILAWLAIGAFWIMAMFGNKDGDASASFSSSDRVRSDGMGRPWAVASTLIGLALYGGGIAFTIYLANR